MHERGTGTYDEIDCSSRIQMRRSFCLNTRNIDNFMFESMYVTCTKYKGERESVCGGGQRERERERENENYHNQS